MKIKVSGKPVKLWINGVLCYLSAIRSAPLPPTPPTPPSPTGPLTWYTVDIPISDSEHIAFGNGKFVVASDRFGSSAAYSTDCINWTTINGFPGHIENLEFLNGKFVSVSRDATDIARNNSLSIYSEDGISWSTKVQSFQNAGTISNTAYGNGKYVGVNEYYSNECVISDNGITWENFSIPDTNGLYNRIKFCNDRFIAIFNGYGYITYSIDGISWVTPFLIENGFYPIDIIYNGEKYCAISGDECKVSTNLVDWESIPIAEYSLSTSNIAAGPGLYVSVSPSKYIYSYDGKTWHTVPIDQNIENDKLVYGNGMFVALGEGKLSYAYWPTAQQEYSSLVDHAITDKSKTASVVPASSSIGEASIGTATIA